MGLARAELPSPFFGPCASQSARAATENRAQNGQSLGSTHLTLPSTPRPTTLGKGQGTTGEKSICLGWIPQGFARACLVKYGLLCTFCFCSSPSLSSLLPSSSPSPSIDIRFGISTAAARILTVSINYLVTTAIAITATTTVIIQLLFFLTADLHTTASSKYALSALPPLRGRCGCCLHGEPFLGASRRLQVQRWHANSSQLEANYTWNCYPQTPCELRYHS